MLETVIKSRPDISEEKFRAGLDIYYAMLKGHLTPEQGEVMCVCRIMSDKASLEQLRYKPEPMIELQREYTKNVKAKDYRAINEMMANHRIRATLHNFWDERQGIKNENYAKRKDAERFMKIFEDKGDQAQVMILRDILQEYDEGRVQELSFEQIETKYYGYDQ